jgi:hypothetical protein
VDLVHEQQGPLAGLGGLVGLGKGLPEVGHAAEHRADAGEAHAHAVGEQAGDGGFARSRRAPQDHAGEAPRGDHAPDRSLRPGQVILSDDIGKRRGAQAVGEWGILARGIVDGGCGRGFGEEVGHWSAAIGRSPESCSTHLQRRIYDIS